MTYECEPRMNTSPQLYRYPNKQPNDNMIKYEFLNNRPPMAYDTYPSIDYAPPSQPDQYNIYNNTMERQPHLYQPQPYQPPPQYNNVGYNYAHDNLTPMPLPQYDVQRYKHIDPDFLDEAIQCIPQLDAMTMDMNAQYRPSNATINPPIYTPQPARYMASSYSPSSNAPSSTGSLQEHNMYSEKPQPSRKVGEKPNPRLCRVPGCNKGIRSRGLCKGHGGGRRCQTAGCKISDQGGGHCIAHGGGRRCSEPGCTRSAQARGRCKCHGGGRPCKMEGCGKNSQRSGYCMSHAKLVEQQKAAALNDGMI
ncbi:hypothetical protein THRCLA_06829 [Thraustotheca clavata]|uniref:WRKY19-like zinc finger domain-containing protein n=1 Tax=Thraustotheca clavata TaxID=74557 RepID=A0A1V9ZIT1_9STRA|nr:hypothetical protein THRCLA_06829 [Thraustotheca clavata]